jgi:hypothetical protein
MNNLVDLLSLLVIFVSAVIYLRYCLQSIHNNKKSYESYWLFCCYFLLVIAYTFLFKFNKFDVTNHTDRKYKVATQLLWLGILLKE